VRAWHHTYGLPVLTTNCSNNYGPYHFPEKLIPLMIVNALAGKPLPVYGDGMQVRDWLYVTDHCSAIRTCAGTVAVWARPTTLAVWNEKPNIEMVARPFARLLDELQDRNPDGRSYAELDHLRHRPPGARPTLRDRCAQDRSVSWAGARHETFETGIRKTVQWYLDQPRLGGRCAERRLPRVGEQTVLIDTSSNNGTRLQIKLLVQFKLCTSNLMQPKMKAMSPLEA
jgi:dTDP-glucose 4,6-dehydratase